MRALSAVLMLLASCGRSGFDLADANRTTVDDGGDGGGGDSGSATADAYVHVPANRAFVTSTTYMSTFGDAASATSVCQQHAGAASLGGTWYALVGDSTRAPLDPFVGARGWEDLAGNYIADQASDWLDESMRRPLRTDQTGTFVPYGLVWIGASDNTCTDWSSQSGNGSIGTTTNGFSMYSVTSCASSARFVCAEAAKQVVVAEPSLTGRILFVTSAAWVPSGGLAGADAHCTSSATAAMLPGTFRAALATSANGVFDRVANRASGFVSLHGREVVPNGTDLATTSYLDAFLVREDGTYARGEPAYWIWTGEGGGTCADWTSTTGTGRVGDSSSVDMGQVKSRMDYACTQARPLLCVQD